MLSPIVLLSAAALLALVNLLLLLALLLRRPRRPADVPSTGELRATLETVVDRGINARSDVLERNLRQELGEGARTTRQELAHTLTTFQGALGAQAADAARTQNVQVDALAAQLTQLRGTLGDKLVEQFQVLGTAVNQQMQETTRTQNARLEAFAEQLTQLRTGLSETLVQRLRELAEGNERRIAEVRQTLEQQLTQLQAANTAKLEEMRQTVDEKLHATLEQRLGESFKQVAERLEQVHRGLGEMQTLAQGVGDLKHLLTNVKTRGTFGEAQLGQLLEQVFAPEQFAAQVATIPGSRNVVDYAVRLPGRGDNGVPLWLPIDAKFPTEDYERLLDAQQHADGTAAEVAGKALEARVRQEAKSIAEKYVAPPNTTDFAILFLPSEGLYSEVLRRPGLMDALQREQRVTLAGPTTLLAMLNSLQMGFRTLALQKRSSEVWQVLGAVKTEFGKFGDVLARVKAQTETVLKTLDKAETRTRVMRAKLKTVEALPGAAAQALLPDAEVPDPESEGDALPAGDAE